MSRARPAVAMHALIALVIACTAPAVAAHGMLEPEPWDWRIEPWLAVVMALAALAYALGTRALWRRAGTTRGVTTRHALSFTAGWLVTLAALAPPIDPLGTRLFSMHMVQHELLMVVAAPLLALGRPFVAWSWAAPRAAQAVHRAFARQLPAAAWTAATSPVGAWLLHAAALWLWHAPPFFQAALAHPWLHEVQHATFFGTALLFWWSIVGARQSAVAGGIGVLALITTMMHSGVLGALLALSARPWYPAYDASALALGIDPLGDQQLGGLLMWIPASVVYLAAALWSTARLVSRDVPRRALP